MGLEGTFKVEFFLRRLTNLNPQDPKRSGVHASRLTAVKHNESPRCQGVPCGGFIATRHVKKDGLS